MAKKFCISSGHQKVSEAGVDILCAGGNAYDAAIAGALVSCVAEPLLNSLGGGGFLLASDAGKDIFFDFFPNFPLKKPAQAPEFLATEIQFLNASQTFFVGPGSVTVPATFKGLLHVHRRLGHMPIEEIAQPAIKAAKDGVIVNEVQAYTMELLKPIIASSPQSADLFFVDGEPLKVGQNFKNPQFADFLESINQDLERDLYEGSMGEKICQMLAPQSSLSLDDFKSFEVVEREPLHAMYRGHKVNTSPAPAWGGRLLLHLLHLLEEVPFHKMPKEDPAWYLSIAHSLKEAEQLKNNGDFSEEERKQWQERVKRFTKGTTHISVCDREGRLASLSMTNGEGSGLFAPYSGIMLNNMLGEEDLCRRDMSDWQLGKRLPSMMAPTIIHPKDSAPIVLGAGGSKRIRSSMAQAISHLIDRGVNLSESIEAPRFNWDGRMLQIEPELPHETLTTISDDLPINLWENKEFYFGGIHGVVAHESAHGDSRRGGVGMVG